MKKLIALLMVAVLALCLCACSSSDTNKDVKVIDITLTEEEYAFGVKKGDAELLSKVNAYIAQIKQDGTFDEICDRYFGEGTPVGVTSAKQDSSKDQLIVATNAEFAPFEYMKGNTFYGVDMEIAAGLAKYLGKELVILHMDFDAVCLSVSQGKADIAMAGLTVKPDREEHVTFSDTYYKASQKLIVMADDTTFDNCKTAEDVEKILASMPKDTKVGTQNGTTGQKYINGDADWEFDGFANLKCIGYKNGTLAVQNIINGNCKLVVIDEAPAGFITEALNKLN
jgi:polar amino acid transport system substrate-binding protein